MTSDAEMTKKPTTSRKKSVVRALLIFLACAAALIVLRPSEPRYAGRPLTSWLQQYTDVRYRSEKQLAEARNAIRSIGIQRSVPTLLKLIAARDGTANEWAFNLKAKFRLIVPHGRYAVVSQSYGLSGFEALGTNAAPAVDALTKLLNGKDTAMVAFQCLERIGKPAEGALCQCLTNQDWLVRYDSIDALAGVTDDAETYISRVKCCFNDTNSGVRVTAVRAIAQKPAPELAIPILKEALTNRFPDVRSAATYELKLLDMRAVAKTGIK